MKRFVLTLAIVVGLSALWSSAARAQYGYYGTFSGGGRYGGGHVRSLSSGVFIQSYSPPTGYGYYGEQYGPGYGYAPAPAYGYTPAYGYGSGYGSNCPHHRGYAPYGYGGYPSGNSIRW